MDLCGIRRPSDMSYTAYVQCLIVMERGILNTLKALLALTQGAKLIDFTCSSC